MRGLKIQVGEGSRLYPSGASVSSSFTPEAAAFISAAGITDPTQQTAINQLVIDLQTANVYTKFVALYPFVGGTASQHKYNLIDPQDTDAAFRLSFLGGWTHNSSGSTPNGTTGYANTFLAGTDLTNNSVHYSFYSGTTTRDAGANRFDLGALTGGLGPQLICSTDVLGGTQLLADNTVIRASGTVADGAGFFIATRTSNTSLEGYRNGTLIGSNAGAEGTPINNITDTFYLGARNLNGSAAGFSIRLIQFASIGDGLTGTEVADFQTAVQTFQTTLSR